MAKNTVFTVKYRRKREVRTNYKKRLALLKSRLPRLIIRKSNNALTMQVAEYLPDGDKILFSFVSTNLEKYGWKFSKKSIPASYLSGLVLGKMIKQHNIPDLVVDLGLQVPHKQSKLYAAIKGIVDAGVELNVDEKVFPPEERLNGTHIANNNVTSFTKYEKDKLDKSKITSIFEEVKKTIMK